MIRLALLLALTACTSPTNPWADACFEMMVAAPTYTLDADSLTAEGWKVLPGDTLAFREMDPGGCDE